LAAEEKTRSLARSGQFPSSKLIETTRMRSSECGAGAGCEKVSAQECASRDHLRQRPIPVFSFAAGPLGRGCQRNFTSASVVSFGHSSETQCQHPFMAAI
jgi:hypothetical protein